MKTMENDNLGDMPREDFRKYGHEIVDWIADYFERLETFPVLSQNQPNDLKNADRHLKTTLTFAAKGTKS